MRRLGRERHHDPPKTVSHAGQGPLFVSWLVFQGRPKGNHCHSLEIEPVSQIAKIPPPSPPKGTSGSTGISLSLAAAALGFKVHVVMPDDQAKEKALEFRETLGAVGKLLFV